MAKWRNILLYGTVLGLLLVTLQFFQYRLLLMHNAVEWYMGVIALLFMVLGIWAGQKWTRKEKIEGAGATVQANEQPVFQPQAGVIEKLGITPRELEVLQLMAQGLSNQEIANRLFVSLNTIKTHASNVFAKLDAQRRTQAIQKAKEQGLL